MRTLPVFVSLVFVWLAFAADGFAQTPAQGPMQVAQAGGASQGAVPTASSGGVMSTMVSLIAAAAAAAAAVATSNTTTSANH